MGEDRGMALREVLEAVQQWYFRFTDGEWYGNIECKFQAGKCVQVSAKPDIRVLPKAK